MTAKNRYGKYYRFLIYLVVVILVNVAGLSLFFRKDMTENGIYSLSQASREAVAELSEPLTIKVFFTRNLPAPHNTTERYLHDLLEEYSVHSNRYFNYHFYDVSAEEGDIDEEAKANQQAARDYGIQPVQIQNIEQDEVKFQRAYMGMVFIHGDVVDKIPAITSTEGLEYTITSKIEKMNNKISALLGLDEPVNVILMYSPSLLEVAPHVRMDGLTGMPGRVEEIVGELGGKYYGKLSYSSIDPAVDSITVVRYQKYNLVTLRWQSIRDRSGNELVPPGQGAAAIVVEKGDKFRTIPLIQVFNVPLFGTQYQLADMEKLSEQIGEAIDDVIDINKKIGYLADHGTLSLRGSGGMPGQMQAQQEGLTNFNRMVSENYSISEVMLSEEGIDDGIDCLIIAGPKEEFNDYELFQLDQFLMKGKSLAIFIDAFSEINVPQNQRNYQQGPVFVPVNTGLEKLLEHYGASVEQSYVLDNNCFEQQLPRMYGGGKQSIYFAPVIKDENINGELPFMNNIKALITIKASPVELLNDTVRLNRIKGDIVFSSSEESWTMSGQINLNPWAIQPPQNSAEMQSYPMALLLSGEFPSYFADQPIPEKPVPEEDTGGGEELGEVTPSGESDLVSGEAAVIERGRPGKLFLVASSELLKNNIIDEGGVSTSSTFTMNLIDHLNGRDTYAEMRGKSQRFNPLRDTAPGMRTFVKTFNIIGLPIIVSAFGILVWARRSRRKRRIQMMFGG
jgi:ABC-type uncharacterized transport system involved in gliding motility auxiliary subunit